MSLLMDALRRAEQVREQGAVDPRDETGATAPEAPVVARLIAHDGENAAGQKPSTEGEGITLSISEVTPVEPSPSEPSPVSMPVVPDPPVASEARRPEPAVSASTTGRSVDHEQARRMLALKARQSRRRRFGYLAGGGVALLLAGLIVIYFRVVVETGDLREARPAMVEPMPEAPAESGTEPMEEAAIGPSESGGPVTDETPQGISPVVPPAAVAPPKSRVAAREAGSTPPQAMTPAPEEQHVAPPLVIVRNEVEDPLQALLGKAFAAYQGGDDAAAESAYRQALQFDTRNRDALLGLAALAQRGGRTEEARQYYRTLLELNPLDSAPVAGLIGLQGGNDPVQDESRIKLLLRQEPEAPYLHFTLGTLFVAQGRWPEAQQAFFDAYRYDSVRADYAFNLAVALDRLGQRGAAIGYYRRALELSRSGASSFNTDDVERRIDTLTTPGGGRQ
ncbi:MAG: tetratricopeptide repeat protein [Gammaproteobacteria bacterium]|nr:tetratricopeptide repeat protein [Gammaproteobacteria bacterium]